MPNNILISDDLTLCKSCHKSIPADSKFCSNCGHTQKGMSRQIKTQSLIVLFIIAGFIAGFSAFVGYKYGNRILYKAHQMISKHPNEFDKLFAQWTVFGIDVSEYQGRIDWEKVENIFGEHSIKFTFIRATAGNDKVDKYFEHNWKIAHKSGFVTGAYHYYRPDVNSTKQAANFINTVKLKEGDFPPILDIEQLPTTQSVANLKKGLKNWIYIVEKHYGIKPVIYSGSAFYHKYLKNDFKEYSLWVANYNRVKKPASAKWMFWQYSERGRVSGISGKVDINVFDGSLEELKGMCLK